LWSGFAYTNGNGYRCSVGNSNCDRNGNCDTYANRDTCTEDYSNSASAPDSSATTVSLRAYPQLTTGTLEAIREFPKSRDLLYRGGASSQR
jgi:hypothetical protein